MSKLFFDTEFLEGEQTIYQLGLKTDTWLRIFAIMILFIGFFMSYIGAYYFALLFYLPAIFIGSLSIPKTPNTIDLISIGIVDENGKEYYAVSKDFNLKEAWNRYDLKEANTRENHSLNNIREYWIRDNVLFTIMKDFLKLEFENRDKQIRILGHAPEVKMNFTYRNFKRLLKKYGKTNKEIANEVLDFCSDGYFDNTGLSLPEKLKYEIPSKFRPIFHAYYGDYDWVVFCWLFGSMIEFPKGFPMYCSDLKQTMDNKAFNIEIDGKSPTNIESALNMVKSLPDYPKEENLHNALGDARWNFKLYTFLKTL